MVPNLESRYLQYDMGTTLLQYHSTKVRYNTTVLSTTYYSTVVCGWIALKLKSFYLVVDLGMYF